MILVAVGRIGGRAGGVKGSRTTTINFVYAVHSFDLTPSLIYDDGRWITPWRAKILFRRKEWEGSTTITFMSAVHSFDLIPSLFIYDDGRWITTWRVKVLLPGTEVEVEVGRWVGEELVFNRGFDPVKRALKSNINCLTSCTWVGRQT